MLIVLRMKSAVEVDERDRKDYFTPSSSCFEDFCDACIGKYRLGNGLVQQGTVQAIEYMTNPGDERPLFHVRTNTAQYLARTVVLALGPGEPIIPSPFVPAQLPACATHVTDATLPKLLSKELLSKIRSGQPTNVLIIGGGLTSAQAVDLCIRRGVSKVYLLMRGHLKGKTCSCQQCCHADPGYSEALRRGSLLDEQISESTAICLLHFRRLCRKI